MHNIEPLWNEYNYDLPYSGTLLPAGKNRPPRPTLLATRPAPSQSLSVTPPVSPHNAAYASPSSAPCWQRSSDWMVRINSRRTCDMFIHESSMGGCLCALVVILLDSKKVYVLLLHHGLTHIYAFPTCMSRPAHCFHGRQQEDPAHSAWPSWSGGSDLGRQCCCWTMPKSAHIHPRCQALHKLDRSGQCTDCLWGRGNQRGWPDGGPRGWGPECCCAGIPAGHCQVTDADAMTAIKQRNECLQIGSFFTYAPPEDRWWQMVKY